MKRDEVYLRHMLDAVDRINGYVARMVFSEFEADLMVQDAVIRQLSIIGEAARHVSATGNSLGRHYRYEKYLDSRLS